MHPALSIIIFTTLSGAGYGLAAALALAALLDRSLATPLPGAIGLGLATTLISAGLLASTLHLKHPERAWRAVSQWRSSWLSREGVAALLTFVPIAALAWGWIIESEILTPAALAVIAGAVATTFCTSMIYHQLKTIPQWNERRVPALFLLLGISAGATLCTALLAGFGGDARLPALVAGGLTALAWLLKLSYWRAIDARELGDTGNATGLGGPGKTVRPLFPPHTQGNYLLSEMGFQVGRKHAGKLRRIALGLGGGLPILLLLAAAVSPAILAAILAGLAAISTLTGTLVERWLFFAEATHSVRHYYGVEND